MCLDVLFQVLGTLECFTAELALVRLERDMDSDVRSDVVALDGGGAAAAPLASQVQIVRRFATNMTLADVFLSRWTSANLGSKPPRPCLGLFEGSLT